MSQKHEDENQVQTIDSLTETVHQILTTPVSRRSTSIESTPQTITTNIDQQPEKQSIETFSLRPEQITTTEETAYAPTDITKDEVLESIKESPMVEIEQQTTSEDQRPSTNVTTEENVAQRISTEALTEAVQEILATPPTVHTPSTDSTTQQTSVNIEEQAEIPSPVTIRPQVEHETTTTTSTVTTTEQETPQPTDIKKDETLEFTKTPLTAANAQQTTSEDQEPYHDVTTEENVAQRVVTDAIIEAVEEILATPATGHTPSIDSTTQQTSANIEEQAEVPSPVTIRSQTEQETTTKQKTEKPTDIKNDAILESRETPSTTATVKETTSKDQLPSDEVTTEENVAQRVSTEALAEAVREILSTPSTVHLPSTDVKVQTIEAKEQPTADAVVETTSEKQIIPDQSIIVEQITDTTVPDGKRETVSAVEQTPTESAAIDTKEERPSTIDNLTETVPEILATPSTVQFPSIGSTTPQTTADIQDQVETPSPVTVSPQVEQKTTTTTEEQPQQPSYIQKDEILASTKPVSATETQEQTTTEGITTESTAQPLSTETISETVPDILALPVNTHLPSATVKQATIESVEEPTIATDSETTSETQFIPDQPATVNTIKTTAVTEENREIVSDTDQPTSEITTEENMAERVSTDALTEAVKEILATPLTVHLPSIDSTSQKPTADIQQQVETLSPETVRSQVEQESTTTITSPVNITEEDKEKPTEVKKDEILESTKPLSATETQEQTTTEDITTDNAAQQLSTDALTEAVREILATPLSTSLPPTDSTTQQTTTDIQEQVETPSSETVHPQVQQEATTITSSVITTEEDEEKPTDGKKDEILASTKPLSVTRTQEPITTEDVIKESAAQQLSTDALTEAVREIIATSSTRQTTEIPTEVQSSIDSLTQIRTTPSPSVTTTQQEMTPETTTTIVTTKETTSQDRPTSIDDTTKQSEAERLSTDALTEAVREILSTPSTVYLPTDDVKVETTESSEQPITDTVVETMSETRSIPDQPTTFEQITGTTEKSSGDEMKKTDVNKHVSIDLLGETVRPILDTPAITNIPSVDVTSEKALTRDEEQTETPSTEAITSRVEEIPTIEILAETAITQNQQEKVIDSKKDEISEPTETLSVNETVRQTTSADQQSSTDVTTEESEARRVSTEALTEAVREIPATPLTTHSLPIGIESERTQLDEQKSDVASLSTPSETTEEVDLAAQPPSTLEKTYEEITPIRTEEHLPQVTTTTVAEETDAEKQEAVKKVTENKEEESLPTNSLIETVRQILAVPASFHLPSIGHITEPTTSVDQKEEEAKPSGGILGSIVNQIKEVYHDLVAPSEDASVETVTSEKTEEESR